MSLNFKKKPTLSTLAFATLMPLFGLTHQTALAEKIAAEQSAIKQPSQPSLAQVSTIQSSTELVSEAKANLMAKLATLAFFSADFTQKIFSEQGDLLQQGTGNFAISKPNLAHWQTLTPDETLIVSDGNTLWFYDPFIEQASAFSLATSLHNTPILLLTSEEPQLWAQYNVLESDITEDNTGQKISQYVVTPKSAEGQIKKLTLSFMAQSANASNKKDKQAVLTMFAFQDATGQLSQINLSNFNSTTKPVDTLFTFSLPEGVRLEDKR